jgi:signal transduction histidine kinase
VRVLKSAAAAALLAFLTAGLLGAAEPEPRRVLIITSLGDRFAPFDAFTSELRTAIARGWPGPVEFLETPLAIARYEGSAEEGPFAEYVLSLLEHRRLDLVVTVGAPAAQFILRQAHGFESVPTLITGVEKRQLSNLTAAPNQVFVPLSLDTARVIENILRVLPDTRQIAVVLGDSPVERYWRGELERNFAGFSDRVSFLWLNRLSLEQVRQKAVELPRHSAILYGAFMVDAAGVSHESDEALAVLRAAASAPLFGAFESEFGRGIVGGPLLSFAGEARRSAQVALQVLRNTPISSLSPPPPEPLATVYDWRELVRFGIPEDRLPAGSEIRFRPPSLWQAYRRPVLFGLGALAVQSLLIVGLLAQRARRRRAETQVHALNRRLTTAQEDERRAIARELHDDFSQRLARLSIDAAKLEFAAAMPLEGSASFPMREELARLSEDVHALAYQLHPSTLDDLGLPDALKIECERFSRLESISVALDPGEPPPGVSRETALCLFRIAQESLRNVARHARAKTVSVSCGVVGKGLRLVLRDDGVGFEPGRGRDRPSLGLASMQERLEILGGRLEVESAPGRGTTISAWAPLQSGPE